MTRKTPKPGAAYYEGGHRFVRDGIPCRMAPWVAELTPHGQSLLLRGTKAYGHDKSPAIKPANVALRHLQTTYLPPEPEDR